MRNIMYAGILNRFASFMLLVVSVCLAFAMMEFGIRIYTKIINEIPAEAPLTLDLIKLGYPGIHDPMLGWIPEPGFSGTKNIWNTRVTIQEHGIRSNGISSKTESGLPLILAVGDSFTFGDEVSDDETWPSLLEDTIPMRVINGGVFGYGLDQTVLRAEKLIDIYNPDLLIVGLIPKDILRTQYDVIFGMPKPYFVPVDGHLELRNVPVPKLGGLGDTFRKALGWSSLAHFVMIGCRGSAKFR
jgi:hypothetical protein